VLKLLYLRVPILTSRIKKGEQALDIAKRYGNTEVADFLGSIQKGER